MTTAILRSRKAREPSWPRDSPPSARHSPVTWGLADAMPYGRISRKPGIGIAKANQNSRIARLAEGYAPPPAHHNIVTWGLVDAMAYGNPSTKLGTGIASAQKISRDDLDQRSGAS